jgi:hypothetical protein
MLHGLLVLGLGGSVSVAEPLVIRVDVVVKALWEKDCNVVTV